jgi:hypothetical protein
MGMAFVTKLTHAVNTVKIIQTNATPGSDSSVIEICYF